MNIKMNIKKIDHIGVVVDKLDNSVPFYRNILGLNLRSVERVESNQVELAFFPVGELDIELIAPTSKYSVVSEFLSRGGGIQHICFEVENLRDTMEVLKARGMKFLSEIPESGSRGTKIAFLDLGVSLGTLIEFCEYPNPAKPEPKI